MSHAGVRRLEFGALPRGDHTDAPESRPPLLQQAVRQLEEYFAKERRDFDLELDIPASTTGFQRDVYDRLLAIDYGTVVSVSYTHLTLPTIA